MKKLNLKKYGLEYKNIDKKMKKGDWQQNFKNHERIYGLSHNVKEFSYKIDSNIIKNYISPFWIDFKGECDLYEFGVYTGGTLRDSILQLNKENIPPRKIWGFDSFEGLPDEAEGRKKEGKHWNKGAFSACDALRIWEWNELEKVILSKINSKNVKLIKGFYENTLNKDLMSKYDFKPAMFVNIDVDLYRSTFELLDWLFFNKLVRVGTVIRYDDVYGVPETEGELLAHNQMCEKYNVTTNELSKQYYIITNFN